MKVVVTGAAGFIGSHLCRRLLKDGCSVVGIDAFRDYYPLWIKEQNVRPLLKDKRFGLLRANLNRLPLPDILKGADAVFHLAAQAGVRASWGADFDIYIKDNIQATHKLLEAAKDRPLKKIVFASSSSVYGLCPDLPMSETSPLLPFSPYGVTKLAAEHLCLLYYQNYGVPSVSLRYFTVYGPGQRPDMAFHKFFKAIRDGERIPVYGDGRQTRDFTYVEDIIAANISALSHGRPGQSYNIAGGHRETLARLIPLFEGICSRPVKIKRLESQKGDVRDTFAKIEKARDELDFAPRTGLEEGLRREWEWIQDLYACRPSSPGRKGLIS